MKRASISAAAVVMALACALIAPHTAFANEQQTTNKVEISQVAEVNSPATQAQGALVASAQSTTPMQASAQSSAGQQAGAQAESGQAQGLPGEASATNAKVFASAGENALADNAGASGVLLEDAAAMQVQATASQQQATLGNAAVQSSVNANAASASGDAAATAGGLAAGSASGTTAAASKSATSAAQTGKQSTEMAPFVSQTQNAASKDAQTASSSSRESEDTALLVQAAKAAPSISYRAHVQNIGWQGYVQGGQRAGTSGRSLRMEALTVKLDTGGYAGGLQMQAHVENDGWQAVLNNGSTMGTHGRALRVEALRLMLTGDVSQFYDIRYRAHVQNIGWQNWAYNGAMAGTSGKSYRIEALEIELVKKATKASSPTSGLVGVHYRAHVQNVGWMSYVRDGSDAGTQGRALRVESLNIFLDKGAYAGGIEYRAHVQNKGWMNWVSSGKLAGTTGQALRVEALQIRLTGSIANTYDVVYSAHVQNVGWQSNRYNGDVAGTTGQGLRVEAVRIQLVPRSARSGWVKNGSTYNYYRSGRAIANEWVVTESAPIRQSEGLERYWIDSSGKLAISRLVNPKTSLDSNSQWLAWATEYGHVLRGKRSVSGGVMLADNDGKLETQTGWLVTDKYDGWLERYRMVKSGLYAVAKTGFFTVDGANYYGWSDDGFVARNTTTFVNNAWYSADNDGKLTRTTANGQMEAYVNWAIAIARDNSHGYSQANRWGPDYDCSSLVISAIKAAGLDAGNATYTGNMVEELTKHGFVYHSGTAHLQRGDILWVHNSNRQHTEIYIGNNQVVGATSSENGGIYGRAGDQSGYEIRVGNYYNAPWMGYLRMR